MSENRLLRKLVGFGKNYITRICVIYARHHSTGIAVCEAGPVAQLGRQKMLKICWWRIILQSSHLKCIEEDMKITLSWRNQLWGLEVDATDSVVCFKPSGCAGRALVFLMIATGISWYKVYMCALLCFGILDVYAHVRTLLVCLLCLTTPESFASRVKVAVKVANWNSCWKCVL
jgi:hypothetical protein